MRVQPHNDDVIILAAGGGKHKVGAVGKGEPDLVEHSPCDGQLPGPRVAGNAAQIDRGRLEGRANALGYGPLHAPLGIQFHDVRPMPTAGERGNIAIG